MANGEQQLAPMAAEAARSVYNEQSLPNYQFTPLTNGGLNPGERQSLRPVSISGRFAVDGAGMYSDFVDTDPELAEAFPESDIEDCARAGQYLLDGHMLLSVLDPKEVEEFVTSQRPVFSPNDMRLRLIAGIQIMFDPQGEDLVPLMVHHRGLGDIVHFKREKLAAALQGEGLENRSVAELMDASGVNEKNRLSIFYFPDETTAASLGEASARLLLKEEPIHY